MLAVPEIPPPPPPRITLRGLAYTAVGWLLYTLLLSTYFTFMLGNEFLPNLPAQLLATFIQAAHSLPAWWVAIRLLDRHSWSAKLLAHTLLAPLYVGAMLGTWIGVAEWGFIPSPFNDFLVWQLLGLFFPYCIQFALFHVARTHQTLRWNERQTARLQALARDQEIALLKTQLNPHFLFNTLNSISALAGSDPEATRQLIARLADLLRYAIDTAGKPLVPLAEEWAFTQAYLAIEQQRLAHRLQLKTQIDPQALAVMVPPLVLQPLVENAVKHGLAPTVEGGIVAIELTLGQDRLQVQVQDNGAGPPEAAFAQLSERGTGLANTNARLQALFGAGAALEIQTPAEGGFLVRFALPQDQP
ncbi:MAG: sensor histidine kinase [Candidatus Latescibacteria bacterium]|nr:sensor histidine kinase [Candidatus Latescibacterota bacterium]